MTILTAPTPLLAGPPGESAYAIAVRVGGFQGSITDWLASLQGQNGVGLPGDAGGVGPAFSPIIQLVQTATANIAPATTYVAVLAIPAGGSTLYLPASSALPRAGGIEFVDETGTCSTTNPITIVINGYGTGGTDKIMDQTSYIMTSPCQKVTLRSNGSNLWT